MDGFSREEGRAFCVKGDWPGLLKYAQEWCLAEPTNHQAPFYVGVAFANLDLPNAAIPAYEKSIALNATDANTWDNLAIVVCAVKGFDAAERYHQIAIQTEPNHVNALHNFGIQLTENYRAGEAIPLLKKAHSLAPENVGVLKSLVNALIEDNELGEVRALLPVIGRQLPEDVERLEAYLDSPPSLLKTLMQRLEDSQQ